MTITRLAALGLLVGATAGWTRQDSEAAFLVENGSKPCKEIKGADLKDLAVRYTLPDVTKSGDYHAIRFYLHMSACGNSATWLHFEKAAFLNQYKDKKDATFWVVREGGADGEFEYSTFAVGLKYLTETFRSPEKDVVNTVTAYAKIHVKTGEKDEWDPNRKAWVKRILYDEGQEVCRTKIDIKLDRITGVKDPGGLFQVAIVNNAQHYTIKENSQNLNLQGIRFILPTGKNKYGHDSDYMGTRIIYFNEADLETIDEAAMKDPLGFVKASFHPWLKGEHQKRKIHWGYSDFTNLTNLPDAKFIEIQDWKKVKVGANEWEVLHADCVPGRVAPKKDEDDPDVKYDGDPITLTVGILYAKPYILLFLASVVEDSYSGVPKSKVRPMIKEFNEQTMASITLVKK